MLIQKEDAERFETLLRVMQNASYKQENMKQLAESYKAFEWGVNFLGKLRAEANKPPAIIPVGVETPIVPPSIAAPRKGKAK